MSLKHSNLKPEILEIFDSIGEEAFQTFKRLLLAHKQEHVWHGLFYRLAYQARVTGQALRLNNRSDLVLPAVALLRVRLEQLIVCSYLLCEERVLGIQPFLLHVSIKRHKNLSSILKDDTLAASLPSLNAADIKKRAHKAQAQLRSNYNPDTDAFQREWTKLKLPEMAERRDKLTTNGHTLQNFSLSREYLVIYKLACSVVHSDCFSCSFDFLEERDRSDPLSYQAIEHWSWTAAISATHYDILQFFEILAYLKIDDAGAFTALEAKWGDAVDKFLPDK